MQVFLISQIISKIAPQNICCTKIHQKLHQNSKYEQKYSL